MLTDFGLVAFLDEGRATSIVGTPEFMPPEVVSGTGHGTDADWWSLGVTLCAQLHAPQPSPTEAATVGDRGRSEMMIRHARPSSQILSYARCMLGCATVSVAAKQVSRQ